MSGLERSSRPFSTYLMSSHPIRATAMKYQLPAMYSQLGVEFTDGNKRLENAASTSGMTLDPESQNVEFRQPSHTVTPEDEFRRDGGFYDCKCGKLGSLHPCEGFMPTISSCPWSTFYYSPERLHTECSKARIDEEGVDMQDYHQSMIRKPRYEEV